MPEDEVMKRLLTWCFLVVFVLSPLGGSPVLAQTTKEKPAKSDTKSGSKGDAKKAEPVDINSASAEELESVKGIGAATAKKIIDGRPYKGKDELVSRKVVSQSQYDKIKDQLVARQSSAAMPPAPAAKAPAAGTEMKKPAPTAAAPPAAAPPPAKSSDSAKAVTEPAAKPPAKGMVWVNLDSKVFHREGDRWYGKTKNGKFMTEAEALKEGYRESKQ
jgi:hypothetical protein